MGISFQQNNLQYGFMFLKGFSKPSEPAPEHPVLTVIEDVEAMLELTPPTDSYEQVDTEVILVVFLSRLMPPTHILCD